MFVWQDIENRVPGYPIFIIRSVSPLKWLFWSLSLSHFGQAKIGWLTQFSRDSLHLSIGLSTFRSVPSWYPYAKLKDISQRDCISCKGRPNPEIFFGMIPLTSQHLWGDCAELAKNCTQIIADPIFSHPTSALQFYTARLRVYINELKYHRPSRQRKCFCASWLPHCQPQEYQEDKWSVLS